MTSISIDYHKLLSSGNSFEPTKNTAVSTDIKKEFNFDQALQLSFEKTMYTTPDGDDRNIDFKDEAPLLVDESIFPAFLSDPVARGQVRQSLVIYNEDGEVRGCLDEDNEMASICDWVVISLHRKADGDIEQFKRLLEENGFTIKTYSNRQGPTYAELFEKMHGMEYSDWHPAR